MAKPKSKQRVLKRLNDQLSAVSKQPLTRISRKDPTKTVVTLRGRIENRIKVIESQK